MKNRVIFSCVFALLATLTTGHSDEGVDGDIAATTQDEVAWGFSPPSKSSRAKFATVRDSEKLNKKKSWTEPSTTENYNDITKKGGWITAEFLYWKPSVSGIPIGAKIEIVDFLDSGNLLNTSTKEHHVNYNFHPGFRVGLGCRLPYDQWDIYGQWTQLTAHGKKTLSFSDDKVIESLWTVTIPFGVPTSLRAKGDIHYKVADLELGKVFYVSKPFSLRPSIGARGAWINQKLTLEYIDAFSEFDDGTIGDDLIQIENKYQAGGLRGAVAANWNFKKGWAFFGKTGASLLWGKFKALVHEDIIGELISGPTPIPFEQSGITINNFNALKTAFDVAAGISWSKVFSQKMRLSLYADYEFNYWPNQEENKLYIATGALGIAVPSKLGGDLGFQGFNLGARFDF